MAQPAPQVGPSQKHFSDAKLTQYANQVAKTSQRSVIQVKKELKSLFELNPALMQVVLDGLGKLEKQQQELSDKLQEKEAELQNQNEEIQNLKSKVLPTAQQEASAPPTPDEVAALSPAVEARPATPVEQREVSEDFSMKLHDGIREKIRADYGDIASRATLSKKYANAKPSEKNDFLMTYVLLAIKELKPKDVPAAEWESKIFASLTNYGDESFAKAYGWQDSKNLSVFLEKLASDDSFMDKTLATEAPKKGAEAKTAPVVTQDSLQAAMAERRKAIAPEKPLTAVQKEVAALKQSLQRELPVEIENLKSPAARSGLKSIAPFDEPQIQSFINMLKTGVVPPRLRIAFFENGVPFSDQLQALANTLGKLSENERKSAYNAFSLVQQMWLLEQMDESERANFVKLFVANYKATTAVDKQSQIQLYLDFYKETPSVGKLYKDLLEKIGK